MNICNYSGEFPIHLACQHHYCPIIEALDDYGACEITRNGDSILHCACRFNDRIPGDIEYLLQVVISDTSLLKLQNKDGNSLMHLSCQNSNLEVLKYMVGKGCDLNCTNNNGDTPLHLLPGHLFYDYSIVDMIVNNIAKVAKENNLVKTFLDLVAEKENYELAEKIFTAYSSNLSILKTILSNANEKFLLLLFISGNVNIIPLLKEN